jgi:hypothetical protein
MKKVITGASLVIALLAASIVNGQVPPPGGGAPPPPPERGVPGPGPGGPGMAGPGGALQPVTAFQGRVMRMSVNDDYVYDGFYLQTAQDSMLVKFPAHLGSQITSLVKVGSTVTVNGTLDTPPAGNKEIRMVSLVSKGQTLYDSPPAAPATPPTENFVNGNGKVVGTQMDREGRMNGLVLDNKTILRIPPGTAGQLAGLTKDGVQVGYSGMQKTPREGEVASNDRKIVHCNTISINGQQFLVR